MSAAWYLGRADLRRRWRSVVALVVLAGLGGAVALTAALGARRTATAYPRFEDATLAPHVRVQVSSGDPDTVAAVERLPMVEAAGGLAMLLMKPAGSELVVLSDVGVGASADGRFGTVVDRPLVLEGRVPDPGAADEVLISRTLADELDLEVGDTSTWATFAPGQLEAVFAGEVPPEPAGPEVTVTVAGIGRISDEVHGGLPRWMLATPAFLHEHEGRIVTFGGVVHVRLHEGHAAVPAFAQAVRALGESAGEEVIVTPAAEEARRVTYALDVQATGLLLFAACAGLAALVATVLGLARHLSGGLDVHPVLTALGCTRRERVVAVLLPVVAGAASAGLLAAGAAAAASGLLPFGLGRRVEPDPGLRLDLAGLTLGAGAVAVVVLAAGVLVAARLVRAPAGERAPAEGRRGLAWATSALPLAGVVGVRFAFQRRAGRATVPARVALAGVVAGTLGVAAAAVAGASLDDFVRTPARWGWNWDTEVSLITGSPNSTVAALRARLVARPEVDAAAHAHVVRVSVAGRDVQGLGVEAVKGSLHLTLVEGRPPAGPAEVALGPQTMERAGVALGEQVTVAGADGHDRRFTVVGSALFPALDEDAVADGAAFTGEGLERAARTDGFPSLWVRFADGIDRDAARTALEAEVGPSSPPRRPADVESLAQVSALPWLLGGFLAAMGAAAVAHALVTAVARRRRDLGVLKALGFGRRGVAAVVVWQSTALVVAGLLVGVPLGIVAGRWTWTLAVGGLDVPAEPAVPALVLAALVPAAALLANAVAALPARAAARIPAAVVLRTE